MALEAAMAAITSSLLSSATELAIREQRSPTKVAESGLFCVNSEADGVEVTVIDRYVLK